MKNMIYSCLAVFGLSVFLCCSPTFAAEKAEAKMKTAIVYYSYTGNTEAAAQTMAEQLDADLIKVEDFERLSVFKAYVNGSYAARKGYSWPIKEVKSDLSSYDRIFIGAPIWWGRCAPEINTYIDQADFSGKAVVVFVTMTSSSPDEALKTLSERIEGKGGKVVSSFYIKTRGMKKDGIKIKAIEIAEQYK